MIEKRVKKRGFRHRSKLSRFFVFSKDFVNDESTYELNKIVEMENKLKRDDLINNNKEETYNFQKFKTKRPFGREICKNDFLLDMHLNNT